MSLVAVVPSMEGRKAKKPQDGGADWILGFTGVAMLALLLSAVAAILVDGRVMRARKKPVGVLGGSKRVCDVRAKRSTVVPGAGLVLSLPVARVRGERKKIKIRRSDHAVARIV